MNDLEQKIISWAKDRNLYDGTTIDRQIMKLYEEIEELEEAVEIKTPTDIQLELGDCLVVLVNIAHKLGYSLERCGWFAYEKIKDRKGRMIDGTFVKENDYGISA